MCLLRAAFANILCILDDSTRRHETRCGCDSHKKGMSPSRTIFFEGWIDIFNFFIAGRPKIKSTHLSCGKTVKLWPVTFFWQIETLVGENVLVVKILCSFAIRTTIFWPRIHLPKRLFRFKKSRLTKFKVAAESINTIVWYCLEYCFIEIDNFIRGSGWSRSMRVNPGNVGNQRATISDLLLVLSISHDQTTLFTRVGDTFAEVSLSMTQ